MKILILFIVYLLFDIYNVNAQKEWAPIGAKWFYTTPYLNYVRCTTIESVGDTIIQGRNCRKLDIRNNETQQLVSTEFISQKNDSIFYFNNGEFYLLYDFSAKVGDTVVVHDRTFYPTPGFLTNYHYIDSISYFKYVITNIDSINIGDKWYKRQKVNRVQDCNWVMVFGENESWIIEKMGSSTYFFGRFYAATMEEEIGLLRCYSDSITEYKNPTWNEACDYISKVNDIIEAGLIKIYPNPANRRLIIESKILADLTIYNLNGQKILSRNINTGTNIIHIDFLVPSMYYCRISSTEGVMSYKLLKVQK